ncbi:PHP domain-containing protein [Acetivibrio saccincola]|jgi:PHP family Zn ribbon phosphoesterase|uniref:PHP domain protein n=1 Tax=Acetivibrio saccincola TaxID=1677857 RepID=A0A2K9E2D5_9FIRM|nr:PHP domain-containing protein [Acetivibrio saccincola]AUG56518.1 PHP domain protein [Acetivibrio saccincola]NLW28274.1 PHP domain-containing protein [Acetivibrio saccincola]PQQ66595.1 phosphoesterase [Acetivibrio saccincola]HOA98238.1 PHP domain-containing protein [Acetivibrio saccincola]HQD29367.1 PHP domain-containing protein [Acetivibrio saccincola]
MRAYYDLHIHSALSPCGENEMTPNNIVNMAWLKGLNIIAVTDHNSAENCLAVMNCAKEKGIVAVPGMELETREEVHLICLFKHIEDVLKLQEIVYNYLPDIKNREDIFGEQIVMDENDNVVKHVDRLLLTAANLSIEEAISCVSNLKGVVIPAHIDRDSYSIVSNLGMIPDNLDFKFLEISKKCNKNQYINGEKYKGYKFIQSSDAHSLGDILEPVSFIDLEEISTECLIETLGG